MQDCEIDPGDPLRFLTRHLEVLLDSQKLRHLYPVVAKRGLRLIADALGGSISFEQTELVYQAVRSGERVAVTLEGGEVVLEVGAEVTAIRKRVESAPYRQPLTVPGETISEELGFRLVVAPTDSAPERPHNSFDVVIDGDAVKGALYIRPFSPGDRIQPLKSTGEKKIQDLLTDRKVGTLAKARLPIVCDMVGPIWVPTICIADRVKVTPGTKRRLGLEFGSSV
jgi:tRNA(Ile)-lysidine synthase